jgi:hypothetical protein
MSGMVFGGGREVSGDGCVQAGTWAQALMDTACVSGARVDTDESGPSIVQRVICSPLKRRPVSAFSPRASMKLCRYRPVALLMLLLHLTGCYS